MTKILTALLLFCLPAFASAQEIKILKGDFDANFSGTLSRGEIGLNARVGAFIQDYLQAGVDVGYEDTDFLTRSGLGVYALRFFETGTYTIPYAGGGVGFNSLDGGAEKNSGLAFTLILGLRYYIADNIALNTEFHSAWASDKIYVDNDKAVDTDFSLRVGLSYLW